MARTHSKGNYRESGKYVTSETPIALTIAGSDSSGGAGLQADLKAFTAVGVYGLTAATAVVAETPLEVRLIEPASIAMLDAQLDLLFASYPISAVKTGMLPNEDQISAIAKHVGSWKSFHPEGNLVVDPIIQSSTGTPLIKPGALECLEHQLLPMADLITPNIPEAQTLLSAETAEPKGLGCALATRFGTSVLLKGGHGSSETTVSDLLVTVDGATEYETERIPGGHRLHGTGCTLSAAITAYLAYGRTLEDAVAQGKDYVTKAISQAYHWSSDLSALAAPN
ncbi:bifunctional hydroxymethylpyrimidine kinase/phosphomethylpyrimidine kinase [bacterium]|nr:bifunctional hydroxymethylpyrimidine kinase/phosphomethylpyrimidine kinase [bacterium]